VLVIDASAALDAAQFKGGFDLFQGEHIVAPPLLWSEARSSLHERAWRGDVSWNQAVATLRALLGAGIRTRSHPRLGDEAWRVSDELGWAKTNDAEYVALAGLLKCRLVTGDRRLRRGADRLGYVIGLDEV
jgi:predicted nucleic acid-binding protein